MLLCGREGVVPSPQSQLNINMPAVTLSLCLIFFGLPGRSFPSVASPDQYWLKFDEYGNISWKEERKRLGNFIIQLRNTKNAHAYLVVYGGRNSCPDEARLRGERVKNYIVRSGVLSQERITILDVGYSEQWSIALYIGHIGGLPLTKELVHSINPGISKDQVKIFKRCEKALSQSLQAQRSTNQHLCTSDT